MSFLSSFHEKSAGAAKSVMGKEFPTPRLHNYVKCGDSGHLLVGVKEESCGRPYNPAVGSGPLLVHRCLQGRPGCIPFQSFGKWSLGRNGGWTTHESSRAQGHMSWFPVVQDVHGAQCSCLFWDTFFQYTFFSYLWMRRPRLSQLECEITCCSCCDAVHQMLWQTVMAGIMRWSLWSGLCTKRYLFVICLNFHWLNFISLFLDFMAIATSVFLFWCPREYISP